VKPDKEGRSEMPLTRDYMYVPCEHTSKFPIAPPLSSYFRGVDKIEPHRTNSDMAVHSIR
jgi:hypothetical protein